MLKKMCLEDKNKRISANDAMKHKYFSNMAFDLVKSEENFDTAEISENIDSSLALYKKKYFQKYSCFFNLFVFSF